MPKIISEYFIDDCLLSSSPLFHRDVTYTYSLPSPLFGPFVKASTWLFGGNGDEPFFAGRSRDLPTYHEN